MLIRARDSHPRSIVKAITWRVTGSLDTFVLSWLITGSVTFAGSIASAETLTKIVLYYCHERAWSVVSWGDKELPQAAKSEEVTRLSEASPSADAR
jgi:uncharacterized membrane protein